MFWHKSKIPSIEQFKNIPLGLFVQLYVITKCQSHIFLRFIVLDVCMVMVMVVRMVKFIFNGILNCFQPKGRQSSSVTYIIYMTRSQITWYAYQCRKWMKVKVVKWCWKKWYGPILMHIYGNNVKSCKKINERAQTFAKTWRIGRTETSVSQKFQ